MTRNAWIVEFARLLLKLNTGWNRTAEQALVIASGEWEDGAQRERSPADAVDHFIRLRGMQ